MPNRILREDWKTSEPIIKLGWREQICFLRLIGAVDDFGRYDGRVRALRVVLYPFELDKMSERDVESCIHELEAKGLVKLYSVQGKEYVEIQKFRQQIRAKESKYPPPPDTCAADAEHVHSMCIADAQHAHTKSKSESKTETNNMTTTTTTARGSFLAWPRSEAEVLDFISRIPNCGLDADEAEACARKYFLTMEECGWVTQSGAPVANWHAGARKWVQRWQLNGHGAAIDGGRRGRKPQPLTDKDYEL